MENIPMMALALLSSIVLWFAVLYRYPALFIPKSTKLAKRARLLSENWIEVLPDHEHHHAPTLQEVS